MIVVTSPTGRIGSKLVPQIIGRGEAVRVIARAPERLSVAVRDATDVVTGSHRDRRVVDRAFDGADTLFWLMPADPGAASPFDAYVTASVPAADAVVHSSIERVVIISALGRDKQLYAGHVSASHAMEDLFRSTGAHVRALQMPPFMDNFLRQLPAIANGFFTGTLPQDTTQPWVATDDIATAAAALLLDRTWTGQDSVPVLGPEDLSLNDIARLLTESLGTPITFKPGDRDADKAAAIEHGFSPAMAQSLIDMDIAGERGINDGIARTPLNTGATTFRRFIDETVRPALTSR